MHGIAFVFVSLSKVWSQSWLWHYLTPKWHYQNKIEKKFENQQMTRVGHNFLKLIIMPLHPSLSIHSQAALCNYCLENLTTLNLQRWQCVCPTVNQSSYNSQAQTWTVNSSNQQNLHYDKACDHNLLSDALKKKVPVCRTIHMNHGPHKVLARNHKEYDGHTCPGQSSP